MGDAYSDMKKAVREHDEFIVSIPMIENLIKTKTFNELTSQEHDLVHSYYQYKESEITSKFCNIVEWYLRPFSRNHFDVYIGNDKIKGYAPILHPDQANVIKDLEKTIDLIKRIGENKP